MASKPLILFAPGAGAPSASEWMQTWGKRLGAFGRVAPFDYPYMIEGRHLPDKLPVLIEAHRAALTAAKKRTRTVILAGKSMGSRVGCHLANEVPVAALICFGYPLVSPAGTMRDEVLIALRTPVLFIQGDRDTLCPLDRLAEVRARMSCEHHLHLVPTGDHSLAVRGGKVAQAASDAAILAALEVFLDQFASAP